LPIKDAIIAALEKLIADFKSIAGIVNPTVNHSKGKE